MALTLEKLKKAREAGYSDDEIISTASQKYPKIAGAIKSGYTIDDIADFYTTSPSAQSISEIEQIKNLQGIPEAINRTGGLPVGGEPEVKGDEDILAKEVGQTKTFMEGPEGKPIEVRRAQAIGIGGRVIPEPISPDGMSLESRAELIKEAGKIVKMPEGSSFIDFTKMSSERNAKLEKLQQAQQTHEANQIAFLSKMISGKSRTQVSMKTGLGEEQAGGGIPVEKETTLVIPTRREASIARIGDQREFIDKIIGNDKFLDYAASKGIDAPSMTSRMAGQYLGVGEAPEKIAALKTNPDIRKLAEEWAMTSPDFTDNASDLFKRAWDGYAGAIGSGVVGPIGLALKEVGLENVGQELIDASVYADEQRQLGQDPRKVGAAMQFGRDVTSGLGFTASAIVTGSLGNTLRAATGLNSVRAVNVFQKANTLTFVGLNSAWQGYSEAKADGATEEQANKAALLTGLTQAPLELVSPLQKWIGRFDPQQQNRLYKGMYKVATAIAEGTEEALFNEMPQQIVGNLVKQYVYKPNQDIFEGTAYAGGVGGVSGVITSIFTQMIAGKKARAMEKKGDQGGSEETDIDTQADEMADKLAPDAASDLAQKMVSVSSDIDNLKEEIGNDEMGLQAFEEGSQERQNAELVLNEKKSSLDRLQKEFDSLSATPKVAPVAPTATPSATIEEAKTKIEQLNTEFDALDENDQAGIDRVNKQIFAEQNKLAELTAIEQGVEPQGTTPTREMGLPPSGRRSPFGTLYRTDETGKAERPILQAFMSATDKVIAALPAFNKGTQKLKNAIRTGIANNAGFLAGTNTKVITSEDYGKLTGRKQTDSDTYKAVFLNGQKYLVVPDINQLAGISIRGEQTGASRDAALDQESRAAAKKIEEEVIHLSMFQGIQDEYKALKNPELSEQEYVIKRLSDIVKEVKRTNPNALPGVSNAYLNDNSKLLDDMTFSQEFMRMVIQRVRTGQITEDLNAIRQAEQEAFSDKDKGAIISLKNSILNALRVVRDSITRYLGKGTSTKEVEKMKNAINAILDEYGIVKGEANYEFKDYSTAQPKGELKAEPIEEAMASVETPATPAARPLPTDQLPTETPSATYGKEAEVFDVFSEAKRKPVELIPNSEVTEEVEAINSLPDDVTYEEIQRVAPATIINLKAASQYVSGSFSEFKKIILNSFKSLQRFSETIWKGIGVVLTGITGLSIALGPIIVVDYNALSGPEGRADLRQTGLLDNRTNLLKPYIKNISVEQLDKSLQTPEETLKLIRDAIKQSKPFSGKIDFDFSSLSKFFEGFDVNNIPSGNKKIKYNYNNLIETSNDEIKSAAEFLKSASLRTQEIESRLREIMGAMEFFTKRNFKDVRFKIKDQHLGQPETRRNENALESAAFVALARNGGMISSLSFYNNKTNTINLDPQTLISILDNTNAATNAAQHIANELTHALQYQTNKGKPIGLLSIKLSDYDTASTALWMRIDMYSQYGKEFQLINAESNWADILVKKYFNAKHKIQPKSFAQITNDQPRIKQALENKQTEAFINEVFSYGGISAEEIIEAKAGVTPSVSETITPAIEAKAGVTPKMDTDYLAAVESGDVETAQRMVDEAAKSIAERNSIPTENKIPDFNEMDEVSSESGGGEADTFRSGNAFYKDFRSKQKGFGMWKDSDSTKSRPATEDEFLIRIALHNKFFPQSKITIISINKDGVITKQENIEGEQYETDDVRDLLKIKGWEHIKGDTFKHISGVMMYDADYNGATKYETNEYGEKIAVDWTPFDILLVPSGDPVTYDDAGNVIPLSQRFDVTSPLIARAGVTPQVKPMSKRSQTAMGRITNNMVSGLEDMAEMLKPKDNKALKEYQSRATQKDKGYNKALISPYAVAGNLFTSNPFTAANNALNKIFRDNPDIDFMRVAQDMVGMDALTLERAYNISPYEQFNLTVMMYKLMPAFREEVKESNMAPLVREAFNLEALNIEAKLATKAILGVRTGAQITQAAYTLRNIVGAGMVIDTYKSNIVYSMGKLAALTKSAFNDVANAVRADRRKSMDKVFNVQSVFRKAVSMMKMADKNPEKVRQSIRAEIGKKKNRSTREIILAFSSGLFDTKEDKYANMVVDQTVQFILAIGMNKKEFSIDNIIKFMYQSFATAARQMAIQQAGIEKKKKGKRSGKYLEMVKAVIGNDNAYKSFLNDLAEKMAEKYPSRKAFNDDFSNLFQSLRSNEWADKLRTQAIQDASEYLNYKFADLFTYLGEQRDANQESVKQHIRAELVGTGASRELIDKFIQDADTYLTQETTRILKDKLGFQVDKKTGKILPNPKPLLAKKIKEEAEAQAKAIKNLKDITKLSATDEGNFKDGLISRIITEVGMPKDQATELANMITDQIEKAMLAQKSENLANALKKAEEVLANNKIKSKTNQRTLLQKLIEMANMGVLDNEKVYEAYRKTHNFEKSFLPYDADFVNALREWGDRIAKLPDGVIRSIEEEKMGRALMEKTDFKAGDILSSYWYYSLLSSIGTPVLNIMSGSSNLVANMFVWGMYSPKSIFPMLGAFYNAINGRESAAVNSFLYVMRYGMNPSGIQDEKRAIYPKVNVLENATKENVPKLVYYLTNFGDGKINLLPSSVNAVLKNISPRQMMRALKASDMFLREVAFEAKLAQAGGLAYSRQGFDMALRQAELEMQSSKATGKQKRQETLIRAKEIFRKIRSANAKLTEAQIEQDALETVFNQRPVGVLGSLANMANFLLSKHPSLKFFVPFTNVVANVSNEFINYTPGLSQARWLRARQEGANSPFTEGRSEKEWEIAIKGGVGFLAMVVPLLLQMNISGDEEDEDKRPVVQLYAEGPRDPKQQRIWRQNGGIKYSIRIGNVYLSLLGTPLVIPLAMSTMLTEEVQAIKKKQLKASEVDYFDLALKALSSPFSIAITASLNQSFLAGVGDILGLTNSKDPVKDGQGIINGIVSRMIVPGQLRDVNKVFTNERAVGTGTLSNFLKEMPGSINFLEKDVNYFGDPARFPSIVKEEGLTQRLASLFGRIVSQETPDEGFKIMYDLNLTPPSWDSSFNWPNGKQMTKTQQLEFIRSAGPDMRQWIVDNEADLREEDDLETRQNLLNSGLSAIKSEYKSDLQSSYEAELGIDLSKQ